MASMLSLKKYNKRLVQTTRESLVLARKPATAVVSAPGRFLRFRCTARITPCKA